MGNSQGALCFLELFNLQVEDVTFQRIDFVQLAYFQIRTKIK
jgi:hypothetical protein